MGGTLEHPELSTGRGTGRLSFPDAPWWPAQAFGSVVNLHLLLDRVSPPPPPYGREEQWQWWTQQTLV